MLNLKKFLIILLFCLLIFVLYSSKVFERFFGNGKIEFPQEKSEILNKENNKEEIIIENSAEKKKPVPSDQKEINVDPLLLKKYSKTDFLDKNYVPSPLIAVNKKYLNKDSRNFQILAEVEPFLEKLLIASEKEKLSLQVLSVYRSFDYQDMLKKNYIKTVGLEEANKFSADAGFSEHQLGTALDFTTPEIGGQLSGFEKTEEYRWLLKNAYQYGFVLSYPENNIYYKFEPWHWRFVGIDLAKKLKEENKYLNDLEQAEIDKYSRHLFEGN
jgi:D-alanyl-D-alanine carboxypeptidase